MKKKRSQSGIKGLIMGIILICLVLGYYYYLSSKDRAKTQEQTPSASAVQEALIRNLDNNYPPSPREVVKYFGQLTQCFYGEDYTQEELEALAMQIQRLYDKELIDNKTQDQYLEDLKWDINQMKQQKIVVSSYSPSSSTDVEYFDKDGYNWARLYCTFTFRKETNLIVQQQIFVLRKDEQGHWKIFGWKPVEDDEKNGES